MRAGQRGRLRWLVWRERLRGGIAGVALLVAIAVVLAVFFLDEFEPRATATVTLASTRGLQSDEGTRIVWNVAFPDGRMLPVRALPQGPLAAGAALCVQEQVGRWLGRSHLRVLHAGPCETDASR